MGVLQYGNLNSYNGAKKDMHLKKKCMYMKGTKLKKIKTNNIDCRPKLLSLLLYRFLLKYKNTVVKLM